MKKCAVTNKNIINYKRRSSAGLFNTSSAGAVTSLILIAILSFCLSLISPTSFNNVSAVGSVSLTVSSDTVDINIAPLRATGTFAKSDNITISASTTNSTGYTLSLAASSSTDYDKLKNTSTNTSLTSITSATTEEAFKALSGTAYNGMWGYLPSKYNSTANTDFRPAPAMGGDILDKTSASNSTANTYSLAIGARVDSTVKLGSYGNTYNVILVANEVPYTITYDDSVVSNMPVDVSSASSASSVNISSTTPTRDGYEFAGWCTVMPTASGSDLNVCSGTTYTAGQAWTLAASDNNLHLYAMWQVSKLWFQNATSANCGETMYDNRGSDAYKEIGYSTATINGLCWMTRNLDLPGGTTITKSDSNITANSYTLPASSTSGFDSDSGQFVYNSGSTSCGDNRPCYSYYSYPAATADAAVGDICPYGWRLPTQAEYTSLKNTYTTGATLTASPFYGVYAGIYSNNSFYIGGTFGYCWSSTASSSSRAYRLYLNSGNAGVDEVDKRIGISIRCVAKQ